MSIFKSDDSDEEPWLQEHRKEHKLSAFPDQDPTWKPEEPKKRRRMRPEPRPLRTNNVRTKCRRCDDTVPMESIRAGICTACQIADFLGPTS